MKTTQDFGNGNVGRLLIGIAVPSIIAMVVNGLYYLVDAAFVGWGVGSSALAGLAVVFPLQMFVIAWGSMLGMGAAALLARKAGEKDHEEAGAAARSAVRLAVLSGIFFLVITLSAKRGLLYTLGAGEGSYQEADAYLSSLQWGFGFVFLSMVGFNIVRAMGDVASAGRGMLLGTVVNLVLDPLFIFGFHMGVGGAAWATVIARGLSTVYFAAVLLSRQESRALFGEKLSSMVRRLELRTAGAICVLGLGNFLGQVCISVVAVIVNKSLQHYGDVTCLAVYGILSRILVFVTMPLLGLAQGLQPLAAYNFGADRMDRVKEAEKRALLLSFLLGAGMYLLPLFAPAFTLHLFSDDPLVIEAGIVPLRVVLAAVPLVGVQIIGFTLFQALGQPMKTLAVSLSRQFLFLVPLLLVLPSLFGVTGLWAAFPAADLLSVGLTFFMLRKVFPGRAGDPASHWTFEKCEVQ